MAIEKRNKMELVPGKTYRGSAIINEFGEIMFTAYQSEGEAGNRLRTLLKQRTDEGRYTILMNKNTISVQLSVDRKLTPFVMEDCLDALLGDAEEELLKYNL